MRMCLMIASAALVFAACSNPSEKPLPPFPAGPHTEEQKEVMRKAASDILKERVKPYYLPVRQWGPMSMDFGPDHPDPYEGCPRVDLSLYDFYDPDRPTPDKALKELDRDAKELAKIRSWLNSSTVNVEARQLYLHTLVVMETTNSNDRALALKWKECSARRELEEERKQELLERAKRSLPVPPE